MTVGTAAVTTRTRRTVADIRCVTVAVGHRLNAATLARFATLLAAHDAGQLSGAPHSLEGSIDLWDESTTEDPTWRITMLDTVEGARVLLTRTTGATTQAADTAGRLVCEALELAGVDATDLSVTSA